MTTGALIFAHNNDHTDYVSMARWSAKNIERHLGIPTHIVTEHHTETTNSRWFGDYQANVTWHNQSRVTAYDVSPWDRTLVLDADYVVASDNLKTVLDSTQEFLCFRWARDVTGINDFTGLNWFGDVGMPMWWATVMCFDKSSTSRMIFDVMQMVRQNWTHYRRIYRINQSTYRNDHALSIALCLVNGHTLEIPSIPWSLDSLTPEHRLQQLAPDHYRVDFVTPDQRRCWVDLQGQDFHAMGKQQLGEIVANNS
jgi:hypothetical protein